MATRRQSLATYALTLCTFQKHRHFQRTANAELFITTLARYRAQGKFLLHAFAVMPDHVHLLLTPAIDLSTARTIQLLKGGYSHAARHQSPGEIWQPGSFEHRIRNATDFAVQQHYIAENPTRANLLNHPHAHPFHPTLIDPSPYQASPPPPCSKLPDDAPSPALR